MKNNQTFRHKVTRTKYHKKRKWKIQREIEIKQEPNEKNNIYMYVNLKKSPWRTIQYVCTVVVCTACPLVCCYHVVILLLLCCYYVVILLLLCCYFVADVWSGKTTWTTSRNTTWRRTAENTPTGWDRTSTPIWWVEFKPVNQNVWICHKLWPLY